MQCLSILTILCYHCIYVPGFVNIPQYFFFQSSEWAYKGSLIISDKKIEAQELNNFPQGPHIVKQPNPVLSYKVCLQLF